MTLGSRLAGGVGDAMAARGKVQKQRRGGNVFIGSVQG